MNDSINRKQAINAIWNEITTRRMNGDEPMDEYRAEAILTGIKPAKQLEQEREFIKLTSRDSNGRPYYSIIYLETDKNGVGHDFEGYSSYDLDIVSDYLKRYFGFGALAQPEQQTGRMERKESLAGMYYQCTACGAKFYHSYPDNYCPHCGAKMGVEA